MTQTLSRPRTRAEALRDYADIDARQQAGNSQYQWAKGDILLEQFGPPTPRRGGDLPYEQSLRAFIDESGTDDSYETAVTYRLVAFVFPYSARNIEVSWTTHRIFASAAIEDRIGRFQAFVAHRQHVDATRPGGVRYPSREAERFLGRNGTRQISREDFVPEVARGLRDMSATQRSETLAQVSVEHRQAMLRELIADPDVLGPVVNDRDNGQHPGVSDAESAFFRARADYVAGTAQEFDAAREEARRQHLVSMLTDPGLSNQGFLHQMFARIRSDWQRYNQLVDVLSQPVFRHHAGLIEASRPHFEMLRDAVQRCIDTLPDSPPPTAEPDDEQVIDVETREAIERFALLESNA